MNRSLEHQALADPAALAPVEASTRGLPAAAHAARVCPARARKSRWPARLDLLQSASGLFLALFLVAHMFFVSSILISHDTFYTVARFFEAGWLFGTPQPWVVSWWVVCWRSSCSTPGWRCASFRPTSASTRFSPPTRPSCATATPACGGSSCGRALRCSSSAPCISTACSPSRRRSAPMNPPTASGPGTLWPLYLLLLFMVEVHGSIGLYRLALKWGWLEGATRPPGGGACAS
jgi:fumarate reductase subunit C